MSDVLNLTKNYLGNDIVQMFAQIVATGITETPDTTAVAVLEKDPTNTYVKKAYGATLPTGGESGFIKDCEFYYTATLDGDMPRYVNIGDETSCNFVSLAVANAEQELTILNDLGVDLLAGTPVFVSGWDETTGLPTVSKADKNTDPATYIVPKNITDTEQGVIQKRVSVSGFDTSLQAIDDDVYLADDGGVTFSAPASSDEMVQVIGQVTTVDAATGTIYFDCTAPVEKIGSGQLQDQAVGVNKLHNDARKFPVSTPAFGVLPAPTGADQLANDLHVYKAQSNSRIDSAQFIPSIATSGSDATNQYQFELYNVTQANSLSSAPVGTNGAELAAGTPVALTVDQNQDIQNGDEIVLRVNILDDIGAGPTDLSTAQFFVDLACSLRA